MSRYRDYRDYIDENDYKTSRCRDYIEERDCWSSYWSCSRRCHPKSCSCCCGGQAGEDGKSAYEIALDHGFIGTETEWLESLKGDPGQPMPFLSGYIEAVGNTQGIRNGQNIVFDTDPDVLDVVGRDISINAAGTIFTINSPGLYRVEWSMNLAFAQDPVLVGLLEDNSSSSALSNNATVGNYSSGALIEVGPGDVPYTIALHNFGAGISISNPNEAQNTAVSIRISRFADGPND